MGTIIEALVAYSIAIFVYSTMKKKGKRTALAIICSLGVFLGAFLLAIIIFRALMMICAFYTLSKV